MIGSNKYITYTHLNYFFIAIWARHSTFISIMVIITSDLYDNDRQMVIIHFPSIIKIVFPSKFIDCIHLSMNGSVFCIIVWLVKNNSYYYSLPLRPACCTRWRHIYLLLKFVWDGSLQESNLSVNV